MKFIWRDRAACIRRIVVMVNCIEGMTMDKAIDAAIHKCDGPAHRYCNEPLKMSPSVREKLRQDVRAILDMPDKIIEAGRLRSDEEVPAT